jgi:hypothetical protein
VRLVIPLILAAIRARVAAPLLRAEREKRYREQAKYSERLGELAEDVRATEQCLRERDATVARCHVTLDAFAVEKGPLVLRVEALAARMAPPAKPAPEVPEARRMAILGIVERWTAAMPIAPAARNIAIESGGAGLEALHTLSRSSVERLVSDLAREGWLVADGKKPRRYSLTNKGRDALRESA